MSKSVLGTVEAPGRSVEAGSGPNKSILDQGRGKFRRQLEYRQSWRDGGVLAVNPGDISRTCPVCSQVSAENCQTQFKFGCRECEYADLNAVINTLRAELARVTGQVNGAVMPSAIETCRSCTAYSGL